MDALTGTALPGSQVMVLETGARGWTDDEGRYLLDVPAGSWTILIDAEDRHTGHTARGILARQVSSEGAVWPARASVYGLPLFERLPRLEAPVGYPSSAKRDPARGALRLRDWYARGVDIDAIELTMPQLPTQIRVGRRFAGSCRGNPVQRIDHVPIEEYVEGVLYGEIRVFKNAETGAESAREVFKAFAVAARTYALWFVVRADETDEYDLDDTACNQRYVDDRDPYIEALVAETTGEVLIRSGTQDEFDKFEYAASCGRHSSWPEYQDDYVPDDGLARVCVGNWCGHDNCAAHQDNPDLPGDDRCLVRGVCQWGGLERSAAGASYLEILAHYQPNLDVRNFGAETPTLGTVRGYVRTGDDLETGVPVPTALVSMDGERTTSVSSMGYFEFGGVEPGAHSLRAEADGFDALTQEVEATAGQETWSSFLLSRSPDQGDTGPDLLAPDSGGHTDPDAGADSDPDQTDAPAEQMDTGNEGLPAFGRVPGGGLPPSSCSTAKRPRAARLLLRRR
jgi:hypothetical protein